MIASPAESRMVRISSKNEIDLYNLFGIEDVKSVIYKEKSFYVIANKRKMKLGYYLVKINTKDLFES